MEHMAALQCAQDLQQQALHHLDVASDMDCPPECTANFKHYKTNMEAASHIFRMAATIEELKAKLLTLPVKDATGED